MILRYYGHSLFTMAFQSGLTLLTDPYGEFCNYPRQTLKADIVTVSHHHHDHDAVSMVAGSPTVLDQPGVHSPSRDILVTGVPAKHDAVNGTKFGDNIIFVVEADGLKIVHLGDLGQILTERQRQAIGTPDVLLTPVGGHYTTDAALAVENIRILRPRITVPMHYQTQHNMEMHIQTEQPFLTLMKTSPKPMPLCRITAGDLPQRPAVILMAVTAPTES
ncbi:MAG TPA: MBL fold metallo-hydrolase [Candidatus Limiplasma sp.]|mgnify:CR=1 FL=1|nr:MBL fold metallo-hydrolase [Candidatus Limiplasma sp.]HPS82081.1 MBL fold metallo-hydrolase [Candidatus Limiplasma sp.]